MTQLVINQQELETLEQMSREVCGTCAGKGRFIPEIRKILKPFVELKHPEGMPCPDCNESGRKWEGLSQECYECDSCGYGYQDIPYKRVNCATCQGSGRVPVSVAEAVLWGISWVISKDGEAFIQSRLDGIFCQIRWRSNQQSIPSGAADWFVATRETPALALFTAIREVE